jgi:hypothetical protein
VRIVIIILVYYYLRWAGAITWHPSLSSVSMARFVTTGAIDPKLCTYLPLGNSNSQTKFRSNRSDSWFGHQGGQNQKHKKCYDSWTNDWIISKFLSQGYLIRIQAWI